MALLEDDKCHSCGERFSYGDNVLPLWRITHRGAVHTEADPAPEMVHLRCPSLKLETCPEDGTVHDPRFVCPTCYLRRPE